MEGNDFVQGTKLKQSYKDSDLYNHKQYGVSMNFPNGWELRVTQRSLRVGEYRL